MKRLTVWAITLTLMLSTVVFATEEDNSVPELTNDILIDVDDQIKDNAYYEELLEACIYNNKVIRNYPFTFEDESWHNYRKALNKAVKVAEITEESKEILDAAADAKDALIQIEPVEDHTLLIWGDDMASLNDPESLEYTFDSWDVPDFKPFLIPYILDDQTDVKGNIILVSGGGYTHRSNDSEGYVIAPLFNELGYNVFVLQRRVDPYSPEDCWMDLQRSIRYIRYHQKDLGLGTDYMIINGYSGGGATALGTIQYLYGDIQPTIYDSDYVSDEIDAVSSDVDVAFIIYGAIFDDENTGFVLENPNLPALFIAVGADDSEEIYNGSIALAQQANSLTMVDLHIFGNVGHGFGKGLVKSNSTYWMEMADNFVEIDKLISE